MFKHLFLLGLLLLGSQLYGQDACSVDALQLRGNVHSLGFSFELADCDRRTVYLSTGMQLQASGLAREGLRPRFATGVVPYVETQFRWFYFLNEQVGTYNAYRGNSGNYLALRADAQSSSVWTLNDDMPGRFSLGALWGLQRQYYSGLHLGLELGVAYAVDANRQWGAVPLLNLQLGWLLWDIP